MKIRVAGLALSFICLFSNIKGQIPDKASEDTPLDIEFSLEGGFYEGSKSIYLYSPGATIFYTLDGSMPSKRSIRYRRPIKITETSVIRAVALLGERKSKIYSQSYFINEPNSTFPVVSISITPSLLFDPSGGLFVKGNNVIDTIWKKPGANFWSRREVPANIEIFEADGSCVYSNLSGFRLFGGMSRLFPQKSIAIVARKRYGNPRIRYPIFGKEGLKKFKFLVLRNSGSDFGKTHFRDGLMTGLVDQWDIEKQAFQPSHVYINGKYWGIYNIREKVNRHFIAAHQDVDKDSIDLLEHRLTRKRGKRTHYIQLIDFLEKHDLAQPANFATVASLMDVENFIDYQIAQIYFDNQDAGGNIKYWRPQTKRGRWRWILYDTDWGFGLHDSDAYNNNSLDFHTEPDGPLWPNPPWSTFILRKLLENEGFKKKFVTRFMDRLNTSFSTKEVIEDIDQLYAKFLPEISRHLARWNQSEERWEMNVKRLRTFAYERPRYMRMHLMEKFNTGKMRKLEAIATTGGCIQINNNIKIRTAGFSGKYFENYPISIKAVPDYGYRFSHWEGINIEDNERNLYFHLTDEQLSIKAVFEKYAHPLIGKVMLNEIGPNNKKAGDWVEIFNYTEERISMNGWVLTDKKNEFIFPNIQLDPNDYLIVCQDSAKFRSEYPEAYNVIGGLGFGLNKRSESIRLFSRMGATVDSFSYEIPPLDSTFSLSLLLPSLDNSDPENWEVKLGSGSPNLPNPYYVESRIKGIQESWMQVGLAAGTLLLCIMLLYLRRKKIL